MSCNKILTAIITDQSAESNVLAMAATTNRFVSCLVFVRIYSRWSHLTLRSKGFQIQLFLCEPLIITGFHQLDSRLHMIRLICFGSTESESTSLKQFLDLVFDKEFSKVSPPARHLYKYAFTLLVYRVKTNVYQWIVAAVCVSPNMALTVHNR